MLFFRVDREMDNVENGECYNYCKYIMVSFYMCRFGGWNVREMLMEFFGFNCEKVFFRRY